MIMSRAMLQAGSYQGAILTNIEKETVMNPTLPYNFSSRPMIHYSPLTLSLSKTTDLETLDSNDFTDHRH